MLDHYHYHDVVFFSNKVGHSGSAIHCQKINPVIFDFTNFFG
ncbi:MAG: hypothetical protein KBC24_02075 [Caldisericia bacterium]|nr:hypothetical protein [Caldisericia bacterium]